MKRQEIAEHLTKLAKSIIGEFTKQDYINSVKKELERINKIIEKIEKNNGDWYALEYAIASLTKDVKRTIEDEREKQPGGLIGETIKAFSDEEGVMFYHGKYVNASTAIDILQKALPDGYNGSFDEAQVNRFIRAFSQYQFRWAREYSPCIYIKGFKSKEEADEILTSAQRLKPNELYLNSGSKNISISLSSKSRSYPLQNDDMLNAEIRVWWD
jgi:hypothetical protein